MEEEEEERESGGGLKIEREERERESDQRNAENKMVGKRKELIQTWTDVYGG